MVRTAVVDGLTPQYLAAGHGPAVVLLHGYTETSRMWKPLMPRLAASLTVMAPDLPGIGGSAIPEDGVDMTGRPSGSTHHVIDVRSTPFESEAKDLDLVIDTVGGETLPDPSPFSNRAGSWCRRCRFR